MNRFMIKGSSAALALSIFLTTNCFAIDRCAPLTAKIRQKQALSAQSLKRLSSEAARFDRELVKLLKAQSAVVKSLLAIDFAETKAQEVADNAERRVSDTEFEIAALQYILPKKQQELAAARAQLCLPGEEQIDPVGCARKAAKVSILTVQLAEHQQRLNDATIRLAIYQQDFNAANLDYQNKVAANDAALAKAIQDDPNFFNIYLQASMKLASLKNAVNRASDQYDFTLYVVQEARNNLNACVENAGYADSDLLLENISKPDPQIS